MATAIHLGRPLPDASRDRPGRLRESAFGSGQKAENCRPYLVLLPVGFAVPFPLPGPRCALTAPFHPYRCGQRRFAFCGTFPRVTPAGRYPAPCFRGARTFLPTRCRAGRPSSRLARAHRGDCGRRRQGWCYHSKQRKFYAKVLGVYCVGHRV